MADAEHIMANLLYGPDATTVEDELSHAIQGYIATHPECSHHNPKRFRIAFDWYIKEKLREHVSQSCKTLGHLQIEAKQIHYYQFIIKTIKKAPDCKHIMLYYHKKEIPPSYPVHTPHPTHTPQPTQRVTPRPTPHFTPPPPLKPPPTPPPPSELMKHTPHPTYPHHHPTAPPPPLPPFSIHKPPQQNLPAAAEHHPEHPTKPKCCSSLSVNSFNEKGWMYIPEEVRKSLHHKKRPPPCSVPVPATTDGYPAQSLTFNNVKGANCRKWRPPRCPPWAIYLGRPGEHMLEAEHH
jgi:hypothetical protein